MNNFLCITIYNYPSCTHLVIRRWGWEIYQLLENNTRKLYLLTVSIHIHQKQRSSFGLIFPSKLMILYCLHTIKENHITLSSSLFPISSNVFCKLLYIVLLYKDLSEIALNKIGVCMTNNSINVNDIGLSDHIYIK